MAGHAVLTMQFVNHYSVPILSSVLLAGGLSLVLRRGRKMRHWLIFAGAMVVLGVAWWICWPEATPGAKHLTGQPMLLEVQSPYCLVCVAMKPSVDRVEKALRDKLVVRRVDIQTAEGRRLADQLGIELTPTFIFMDAAGNEQWRSVGKLDGARVRASVSSHY